jgi:hypothetical protein
LLDLDERLRDAVAQVIGQAAAGVVRQLAMAVLGQAEGGPTSLRPSPRSLGSSRPLWETLDEPEERDRASWSREREEDDLLSDDEPAMADERDAEMPQLSLWRQALAVALPALAWWLHRRANRWPPGATLGCGLVCGLALARGGSKTAGTGLALTLLTDPCGPSLPSASAIPPDRHRRP